MIILSSYFNPSPFPETVEEKFLKNRLWVHDANFSCYDTATKEWEVYEVSKMTGKKHAHNIKDGIRPYIDDFISRIQKDGKTFDVLINGQFFSGAMAEKMGVSNEIKHLVPHKNYILGTSHHVSHVYASWIQSPFEKCVFISWDSGSHDGDFVWGTMESDGVISNFFPLPYKVSREYTTVGSVDFGMIRRNTEHTQDICGKLMGLCAYGKIDPELTKKYLKNFLNPSETLFRPESRKNDIPSPELFLKKHGETEFRKHMAPVNDNTRSMLRELEEQMKNDSENSDGLFMNHCASVQEAYEQFLINFLADKKDILEQYQNRLIICGGSALNVLANERVKNEYDLQVYVPPNPGDDQHSIGTTAKYIINHEHGESDYPSIKGKPTHSRVMRESRHNLVYRGMHLKESFNEIQSMISQYNAKIITHKDIVTLLEDKKILGFLIGRSELGPRALGHRSIICDPSFPDMKDILNSKVKFREWYRPFAPMCLKEDAEKYFISKNFDNMEYMSFAPLVKSIYRKKLPSITHIDGSARLQVIDSLNPELEDYVKILRMKKREKVLLNTSFNIQGKPILNSLSDALKMLQNTGLDHVILKHEDVLFKFG